MTEFTDNWIAEHSPIAAEKLHALGVVNFHWNSADIALKLLGLRFGYGGKSSFDANWATVHDAKDVTLCDTIRTNVAARQMAQPIKDAVLYALHIYDINRQNRNQLSHFMPHGLAGSDLANFDGPEFRPKPFPDSTKDIRRVADEIVDLVRYLSDLLNYFPASLQALLRGAQIPLPTIPPEPKKLWNNPRANRKSQSTRPPRQPSVLKLTEEQLQAKAKKDARLKAAKKD